MKIMNWLSALAPFLITTGCVVEAGNPSTKSTGSGKGKATINFARTLDQAGQSLTLNVQELSLVPSGSSDASSASSLKLSNESLELYGDKADDTALAASGEDVPAGTYESIRIRLNDRNPGKLRSRDSAGDALDISELPENTFYIAEKFEIKADEDNEVTVRLDLSRSIGKGRDGRPGFNPIGDLHPRGFGRSYQGAAPGPGFIAVCAYGYEIQRPPMPLRPRDDMGPGGPRLAPPPPPLGIPARRPRIYETRAEIALDTSSACEQATAKAVVSDAKFSLDRVPPGKYALRFFKTDGSFVDGATDADLK